MAEAVIITLAEAVKDVISGASLSQGVTVSRAWRPAETLEGLDQVQVTVLPRAYAAEARESRGGWRELYDLFVVVRKRIDTANNTDADAMALLGQEIGDLFRGQLLAGYPQALCQRIEAVANDPQYIPEHWDNLNQFTAVWRLTFRLMR